MNLLKCSVKTYESISAISPDSGQARNCVNREHRTTLCKVSTAISARSRTVSHTCCQLVALYHVILLQIEIYPDLAITQASSASTNNDEVYKDNTFDVTITVHNVGEYRATNVVVTQTLPTGLTFASSSPSGTRSICALITVVGD